MPSKPQQSTVRITPATRELLAKAQQQTQLSQSVIVEKAMRLYERALLLEEMESDFRSLAADPSVMRSYREATAHLDNTASDGLERE